MGSAQTNFEHQRQTTELALVKGSSLFSAPEIGLVDRLLTECQIAKKTIEKVATMMADNSVKDILSCFSRAQNHENSRFTSIAPSYDKDAALKVLYSDYWRKALALTDVLDFMPSARREEWNTLIAEYETPEFEENVVKSTLKSLLAQREQFFGEMVEGIFFGLSKKHVTNCPEGFSKRMILAEVLTPGDVLSDTGELVHDFRYVITKLMGRDAPCKNSSSRILNMAKSRPGDWLVVDGGAFKVKVFKKRTAHLEVHPDLAWQMNQILAINNPMAIPSRFRTPPKKAYKETPLNHNLVSNAALALLKDGRFHRGEDRVFKDNHFYLRPTSARDVPKSVVEEASNVLILLGGVPAGFNSFEFDYDVRDALALVDVTGMIPDFKTHQYYPTREALSRRAIDLAEIDDGHRCLEPSAGTGGIAQYMPKDQTLCIEISELFTRSLTAQGYDVINKDFLKWSDTGLFDRVVMNPPFSDGRALAHLSHAADMLAVGGRLVAILPASLHGKKLVPAMHHTWHGPYQDQFTGTNGSVSILVRENWEAGAHLNQAQTGSKSGREIIFLRV